MARTRSAHLSSANGQVSRIEDRQNRWASEATQGSRDTPRRPGTMPANPHSWADNRALLEDSKQAFVRRSAFPYIVPTALRWTPLFSNASAGPRGCRSPRSQWRRVPRPIPIVAAKRCCVIPSFLRSLFTSTGRGLCTIALLSLPSANAIASASPVLMSLYVLLILHLDSVCTYSAKLLSSSPVRYFRLYLDSRARSWGRA